MLKHLLLFIALLQMAFVSANAIDVKPNKSVKTVNKSVRRAILIEKRCVGGAVELFTIDNGTSFKWYKDEVPQAETSNTYKPTEAGKYKLIVDGVASNEIELNFANPTGSFTHNATNAACGAETVKFTNTSTNGETYLWDFGDGTPTSAEKDPTHEFKATPGGGTQTFNVKLTVTSAECKVSPPYEQTISVKRLPNVSIADVDLFNSFSNCHNNPNKENPNYTLKINNTSPSKVDIISYTIDWGDNSTIQTGLTNASFPISHNYTELGAFQVKVTAYGSNGCSNQITQVVANQSNPAGGLGTLGSTTGLCAPAKIPFVISNWQNNSPGTVYVLEYGDGVTETFNHPLNSTGEDFKVEHIYERSSCPEKTFTAKLFVKNACDVTPYTAGNIQINIAPQADFVPSSKKVCLGNSVKFTDKTKKGSYTNCSSTTIYLWDFGDGSTSDAESPSHTYSAAGTYTVKLTTSNPCGATEKTDIICVNPKPTATFTLPTATSCAPFTLKPTNTSSAPNCGTNTYQWVVAALSGTDCADATALPTYANGTNLNSANPEFKFDKPGKYRITLTTTSGDASCSTTSLAQDITVKAPPTAVINLTPISICEGASISPTATVKNCYGTDASYAWEFPGASTTSSTSATPTNIVYPTKGTYTITLKITNDCGTNTYTQQLTVTEAPVLNDITDKTVCNGATVSAINFGINGVGSATYTWTNSNTAIGLTASGSTASLPSFIAKNTGTTPITVTITVTPKSGNCTGLPKTFTITVNPAVAAANAGANLSICDATSTRLMATPAPTGGMWSAVSGTGLTFDDASRYDATVSGLVNGGSYVLKWTVQGYPPCGDSESTITITVAPQTVAGTTSGAATYCGTSTAGTVTLSGHVGTIMYWESSINGTNWTAISPLSHAPTLNYNNLITTTYYRAVVKSGSCAQLYSTETKIEVAAKPLAPTATPNYTYCLNDVAPQLTATGADLKWYKALPLNSANLLTVAPTPNTTTATTTNYYVTQTVDGCESTSTTISVKVNPAIANNSISANQTICKNGTPAQLKNSGAAISGGSGSFTYQWQSSPDGTTFTDIPNATALTYQPGALAVDTYYRRIVNSQPCSSESNVVKITVQGELTGINISVGQTICYNTAPAKLIGEIPMGGSGTFSYAWQKSTTSATNGFNDIIGAVDVDYQPTTLTQTTYFRRIVTSGSCNGTSNVVTIKVTPLFSLQQLPDLVLCNNTAQNAVGFAADLNSSNISYKWTNNETVIGLAASGDNAMPAFTTTNAAKKPLIATITYKGTYMEDGTSCEAPAKNFKISVLPTIIVTTDLPDLPLCTNIATTAIALSSDAESYTEASVKYRWTSSLPIGLADGEGAEIPSFTTINTTDAPITATITVTPLYTYGGKTCEGRPKPFQITVNPAPKVNFSILNQVICSGSTSNEVTLTSATSNVSISWTAQPVAGITGLALNGTDKILAQTLINTTNAPITVVYVAKATTSGNVTCAGVLTEYKITVNPIPVVTADANNKTICSNERVNIALNSNVAGTKFLWTVSPNANVTGIADGEGAHINQILINTSVEPQMVTYTVMPAFENGQVNCNGVPIEIKVLVNPAPTVSFSEANMAICSGKTTASVTLSSTTPNAKITWQAIVPSGITGVTTSSGTVNIPAETLHNTTNSPLTVVYKAVAKTDDANACAGTEVAYKVVVNPVARVTNNKLEQNVCSGGTSNEVVLQSNVAIATFSWTATASATAVTGFVANGTGNIPVQTLINTSAEVQKITYQISLSAYDCEGVSAIYEIYVYPSPIFTSNQLKTEICSGKPFVYVPTSSTTGVTFTWTRAAIDGISNAAANGSGVDAAAAINETLTNTTVNPIEVTYEYEMSINGCATGVKNPIVVTVNPPTTANFGLSEINGCAPFNLVIKNLNSRALVSTYTVDFGDGSPLEVYNDTRDITHTYENDTKLVKLFYITITTKNECGEVVSKPYEIRVQPQTVFSKLVLDATQSFGCSPFLVDFTTTNQTTGANLFIWDFGDGSPLQQTKSVNKKLTHIYAVQGNYTVTLTATNGCSTVKTTEEITVYPQVNTNFSINTPQECVGTEVLFTNQADAQFTSLWDFGDGITSTDINPKHSYATPGLKTITLKSTRIYPNGGFCTAVATKTVQILAAPVSSFTTNAASLNCSPFTLRVSANAGNAVNIEWNFGDVGSAENVISGLTATHIYTKAGDYVVTAKAYNAQGCTSVSTQIVRITESAIAAFSASTDKICGTSGNVKFKNESTYSGNDVVAYKWLVNNSEVAVSKDLSYDFTVPVGATLPYIFKVRLEATNVVGCKTVQEKEVQFNPFPQAVFTVAANKGCVPFKVSITNQSVYANNYQWFLDGTLVSTDKEPQNIILTDFNKTYGLKLVTTNQYGCTQNEQTMQLSTYPYLKAAFTVAQDLSCNGLLNLAVTNASVGATSYTWDYGDGSPLYVGVNPQHSYGVEGEYNLKLKISNGFCTDEYVKKIIVSNAPKAAFLSDVRNGCNQLTVTFRNTSTNAATYLWDFGDGTFSTEENPAHRYVYANNAYTVKLTIKNRYGCSDEMTKTDFINVYPPPEAQITIAPNKVIKVPDYSFTFKALTNQDIISYKWDFGDGTTADRKDIIHRYDRFGIYKVKLHITNRANCTNVIEDEVTILDFPGFLYIPNAFEPENLNNDLKVFKVKGGGMATYDLKIYNKWGQLLWQTNKLDQDGVPLEYWDGKMDGTLLPQGAYYWKAEATFINGGVWKGMKYANKSETKVGVVHLIR